MEQRVDVPASHEPVLGGDSDDSGHFVGILAVGDEPSDGLGVIPSDILDGHCILSVEVSAVEDLERPVSQRHTYFAL